MHKFQPRGIIKWSPFAALYEYQHMVELLNEELDREVNLRSPEFLEYIDLLLQQLTSNEEVLVQYQVEDEVLSEFGSVKMFDSDFILINGIKIHKQKIIDIII